MNSYTIEYDEHEQLPEDAQNVRTRRDPEGNKIIRFQSDEGPQDTEGGNDNVTTDPVTGERRKTPWSSQ